MMNILEIIARIDEMVFKRKAVIDKLRALQPQINAHALKIIVYPDSRDVPHWRRELIAWGNDLTQMQLRGIRGVTPMGYAMAWNGLYREPFEGAEDRVLRIKLGIIMREYHLPIAKNLVQIMSELTNFLQPYCQAIGGSQFVDTVVNSFNQRALESKGGRSPPLEVSADISGL